MYGISNNTRLKLNILETLDDLHSEITTEKLTNLLRIPTSQSTVKKLCKELMETINTTYPKDDIQMVINSKGVRLDRTNFHFGSLIHLFFSKEVIFELFHELMLHRTLSTAKFCAAHFISDSQLRRIIGKLNVDIKSYGLHISVATEIKIKGPEYRIRYIYFLFLYFCYRKYEQIDWLENATKYSVIGDNIAKDLGITPTQNEACFLHLWTFVNQCAIDNGHVIPADDPNIILFTELTLPLKPKSVRKWSNEDWTFFITTIFTDGIVPISVVIDRSLVTDKLIRMQKNIWIKQYELHFAPLTGEQLDALYQLFFKHTLSQMIFPVDQLLIDIFQMVDVEKLRTFYPIYLQTYDTFWDAYTRELGALVDPALRLTCLLFSASVVPFSHFFPVVNLYFHSNLSLIYQNYIKERIRSHFLNQFIIQYTDDISQALIIVSTTDQPEDLRITEKPFVLVNNTISVKDFQNIQESIHKNAPDYITDNTETLLL